jgi:NAD(P)-dependent dehydrogenase (short-subunit alcohol dehydrogenase family)
VDVFDVQNDVVLITGAGAGIGFGIAEAFHNAGAKVALGDVREDALGRSVSRLGVSERVFSKTVDVRDGDSVREFVEAAEARLGPVTVMVANAGVYPSSLVLDMDVDEWDRVMETNVRGVFLACQAAARSMVSNGKMGKIITLSSGSYLSGRLGASHYCASKAGVVMFTKVLALELAQHKINVNCIAPGLIDVEGEVSPISDEYKSTLTKAIPWGRIGEPKDIANAALFLASPYADFITGEVLAVNGGSAAGRAFLPISTPS